MQPSMRNRFQALQQRIQFHPSLHNFRVRAAGTIQKFRARGLRGNAPQLLVTVGVLLLLYVGVQYGSMYAEQRKLAQEWERQNQLAATPVATPISERTEHDSLTRLSIPKINLDAIVVEGTSRRSLLLGPGHMESSAFPGELGNAVITAHRDTFFRHIYELNKGDEILVQRDGKMYRYEVTGKRVVQPSDVSVTHSSSDAQLTLITCYPTYYIGPAPERLVVFSKLVPDGSDANTPFPAANATTAVHARE
jgi:sortase A